MARVDSEPQATATASDTAEVVVADDATVGHLETEPRQATGSDRGRAAHREVNGTHQLPDLAELRHRIIIDDQDVRIDVADDVDVGFAFVTVFGGAGSDHSR